MKLKQILDSRFVKEILLSFYPIATVLQGTLDSVNQIAAQTYANFNKEGSGSRESLTSLASQLSLNTLTASEAGDNLLTNGKTGASSSDLPSSASSGAFFSLGEDDDPVSLSNAASPTKTPTPASASSGEE